MYLWRMGTYCHRFRHEGVPAIATIYRKSNDFYAYYDVEYDGKYYCSSIKLSKKAYRQITVGERFDALILPKQLKYHSNTLIFTPSYVRNILSPRPIQEQNVVGELERIDSLYNYK